MSGSEYLADTNAIIYLLNGNACMKSFLRRVHGSRKVILRKVSTTYDSLSGAKFTISKGSKQIEGTDVNGTADSKKKCHSTVNSELRTNNKPIKHKPPPSVNNAGGGVLFDLDTLAR